MKKIVLAAMTALIILTGCRNQIPLSNQTLHLLVNGLSMEIPLGKNGAFFDVQTLNSEFPNTFELVNKLSGVSISVNGQRIEQNKPLEIAVNRIAYNENIEITIRSKEDRRTMYIRALNSAIPTYTTAGISPHEGHYYLTLLPVPVMLKLDKYGEIIYYLCPKNAKEMGVADIETSTPAMSYWDFKKHVLSNGRVLYSYHEQNPYYNRLNLYGYAGGTRVILDERYKEINRIILGANYAQSVNAVDGHDFYLIDENHYIVSNYELKLVYNIPASLDPHPQGSKVVTSHIQEVKNGEVLLDWYSTDYPELYALSESDYNDFANRTTQQPDYIHFNSVDIDTDGNLICSFRNISTILKIDRNSGDIMWKLSGNADEFGLTDYQKTSNQHYTRRTPDGYITIFDNNVRNQRSRVLKIMIDEEAKRVLEWKEFIVPGHFSVVCGSAVNLENDVFVIGWGFSVDGSAAFTEIDFAANQKLFELTFSEGMNATYRAVKY